MGSPYYIQRCMNRKPILDKPGFDAKFRCDYMGSAEFEYGSIPRAFKRLTKWFKGLEVFNSGVKNYKGEELWFICTPEVWKGYREYIPGLVNGSRRLQEASRLQEETEGKSFSGKPFKDDGSDYGRVDLWWDIDNDVLFAYGEDQILLVLKSIEEVRLVKLAAGDSDSV